MKQFCRTHVLTVLALVYGLLSFSFTYADNPVPQTVAVTLNVPTSLVVNDNDDNDDEDWDFNVEPVAGENDTGKITVTGTADKTTATVTVSVTYGAAKIEGFWQGTKTVTGSSPTGNELNGREKRSAKLISFTVPPGKTVTQTLYVEGIQHSASANDVHIKAVIDAPADTTLNPPALAANAETTETTTVYQVDLDVDSNNDNAFDFAGFNDPEDKIELSNAVAKKGKICVANNQRHPLTVRVPVWADGFNLNQTPGDDDDLLTGVSFVPVRVTLQPPFNPATAQITFTYPSSDPGAVTFTGGTNGQPVVYQLPAGGHCRLWRRSANTARDRRSVANGGDFVPVTQVAWSSLFTTSTISNTADLYLEVVRGSAAREKLTAKVTVGSTDVSDSVYATFESIEAKDQGYFSAVSDNVWNYVAQGARPEKAALNRLQISSDIKFDGPASLSVSATSSQSSDTLSPASGTTTAAGTFATLLRSRAIAADHSQIRTLTIAAPVMEHKMRPALYREKFSITAYSTPKEGDFNGLSGTDTVHYIRALKSYYIIHSTTSARIALLKEIAMEGFGYTSNGTCLGQTHSVVTPPQSFAARHPGWHNFYQFSDCSGSPAGGNIKPSARV